MPTLKNDADPSPETTLVSGDQPTNQPTGNQPPKTYISLRVTCPHDDWSKIECVVNDAHWYISYPHLGSHGNNPHFHVLLPGSDKRDAEKLRNRLKKSGYSGNKQFSIKYCENGLSQGIQYCSREQTTPQTRGDVSEWIAGAPRWLEANLRENLNPTKKSKVVRDDSTDNMTPITSKGALYQIWKYRKEKLVIDLVSGKDKYTDIGDVILHMLDSGKFYLAPEFARQGLPEFYKDVFTDSCHQTRLTFKNTKKQWLGILFRPTNTRW